MDASYSLDGFDFCGFNGCPLGRAYVPLSCAVFAVALSNNFVPNDRGDSFYAPKDRAFHGIRDSGHVPWRAWRGSFAAMTKWTLAFGVFLVTATFAASDEFHQSFVPTRTASAHDVMIDCMGAFVAVAICLIFADKRISQTATS